MSRMQFYAPNFLNTTTMLKVNSNTDAVANLFDRDVASGWTSSGYTGATQTTISIEFGTNTVIDALMLRGHNFQGFRAFYNSVTANAFNPAILTTTNSNTSSFFSFATITVSSIQLQINSVFTGTERYIQELVVSALQLVVERNPAAADYKAQTIKKQIVHGMPDGGVSVYNIDQKYEATIGYKFVTQSFHDSLLEIWEAGEPVVFVPFATTSAWSGLMPECAWVGPFTFKYSSSGKSSGYSGSIALRETS